MSVVEKKYSTRAVRDLGRLGVEYAAVTAHLASRASRIGLAVALVVAPSLALPETIEVRADAVSLSEADPSLRSVGALEFRGGLRLSSPDARFGGWSGLHVSDDGAELTAIGDEGHWLTARIEYDGQGQLAGLADATLGPLHGEDGAPLAVKTAQDAESLARLPDGAWLVGFEHWHRLRVYRGREHPLAGRPTTFTSPPDLERAPSNGGLEALAAVPDGRLVALSEEFVENGLLAGWVGRDGRWERLHYRASGAPVPSDMTALPSGDLLVLERSYAPLVGNTIRVRLVPATRIAPGALLEGRLLAELKRPLTVDNFEGIATRRNERGETLVYLLSDDNHNPLQRTLLLMFALDTSRVR
jgi:hypothetical protein